MASLYRAKDAQKMGMNLYLLWYTGCEAEREREGEREGEIDRKKDKQIKK
jgi:hypothetical protein